MRPSGLTITTPVRCGSDISNFAGMRITSGISISGRGVAANHQTNATTTTRPTIAFFIAPQPAVLPQVRSAFHCQFARAGELPLDHEATEWCRRGRQCSSARAFAVWYQAYSPTISSTSRVTGAGLRRIAHQNSSAPTSV
jgi:hypothetical protein